MTHANIRFWLLFQVCGLWGNVWIFPVSNQSSLCFWGNWWSGCMLLWNACPRIWLWLPPSKHKVVLYLLSRGVMCLLMDWGSMCLREPVCFRAGFKLNNPLLINQIPFMFPLSQWGMKGLYDYFKAVLCFEYSWVLVLVLLLSCLTWDR